jgi:hypothetical protein
MASVMNVTAYPFMVILCRIAQIAGQRMKKELKSALIANNLCMKHVVGVRGATAVMGRNVLKRNALGFRTVVS